MSDEPTPPENNKPDETEVPESVLNQINEWTEGFILFSLDENFEPSVYSNIQSRVVDVLLHEYIRKYSKANENLETEMFTNSLLQDLLPPDSDSNDEDPD